MSGLVGIIANDSARYSLFASCVTRLDAPSGTAIEWLIGGDWCRARNDLAQLTLDGGYDWLWFMDDDHSFGPDLLQRQLAHKVPLCVPLCFSRAAPFLPVVYSERGAEGEFYPINLAAYPDGGLVEVEGGGAAGMLIRRNVLLSIEPPWFEYSNQSEDLIFCIKAKQAGFPIHCDLDARLGHITTAEVIPAMNGEGWVVGLRVGRDYALQIPIYQEEPA